MRCVHCGEWNQAYMVFFTGPEGIKVMRHVYSASAELDHLEAEARKLLEKGWDSKLGCTVWDLAFESARPITEEESAGPDHYSRPAS